MAIALKVKKVTVIKIVAAGGVAAVHDAFFKEFKKALTATAGKTGVDTYAIGSKKPQGLHYAVQRIEKSDSIKVFVPGSFIAELKEICEAKKLEVELY